MALADTQIVRGHEQVKKSKLELLQHQGGSFFIMTSGLRSVRDKLMLYADSELNSGVANCTRLFEAANLLGVLLRKIREEDGAALAASNFSFNINIIIGGKLSEDGSSSLFYIYPEGNWVELNADSAYCTIGRSYYAKPLLDLLMHSALPLDQTIALAVLAFEATQASVTDVDYPIDMISFHEQTLSIRQHRYKKEDLSDTVGWWQNQQGLALENLPKSWADTLLVGTLISSNSEYTL